jgi:hypothetical protein
MDCKQAEEQFAPYLLGAMEPEESARMDRHIDSCADCQSRLRQEGGVVTELAYAVPQLSAPPNIQRDLFARIDAELSTGQPGNSMQRWLGVFSGVGHRLVAHGGVAVASVLVVVMVLGGIRYDSQLNAVAEENQALEAQIETVAEGESEMKEKLEDQLQLTIMASQPETSVLRLSSTDKSAEALGTIVVSLGQTDPTAVITAIGLRPLPDNMVYKVWLVSGDRYFVDTGFFTVDSTGYGMADILLSVPLDNLDGIIITVEQARGGDYPTGERVLKGDL